MPQDVLFYNIKTLMEVGLHEIGDMFLAIAFFNLSEIEALEEKSL